MAIHKNFPCFLNFLILIPPHIVGKYLRYCTINSLKGTFKLFISSFHEYYMHHKQKNNRKIKHVYEFAKASQSLLSLTFLPLSLIV